MLVAVCTLSLQGCISASSASGAVIAATLTAIGMLFLFIFEILGGAFKVVIKEKIYLKWKWLNWMLNRRKGIALSILLIILFISLINWMEKTNFTLIIALIFIFFALAWFFIRFFKDEEIEKTIEIKAKKNENEANKSQEIENSNQSYMPKEMIEAEPKQEVKEKIEVVKQEEIENKDEKTEDKKSEYNSIIDELTKLGALKEKGLLTEDEFNEQKKKLLKQ